MIAEPDVALTDFALAVEGAWLGALVHRRGTAGPARRWWAAFFWAVAASALLGGVSHGFLPAPYGPAGTALWRLTMVAVGAAALGAWGAAAQALGPPAARWIVAGASVVFATYAAIVLLVTDAFALAIVHYAPAAVFLFVVLLGRWRRTGATAPVAGMLGLLTLAAGSLVQWWRLAVHPVFLTHNAVYHLFEMLGLLLLYRAGRWLSSGRSSC